MLPVLFVETVYTAPADDCVDYCPLHAGDEPAESDMDTMPMGFRELVRAIQHGGYVHPSSGRSTARDVNAWDWLSAEIEQDYRTGDYTERSIHLDVSATPHQLRYWRLAWKAAGIVKA